jgi:hypothetical protein
VAANAAALSQLHLAWLLTRQMTRRGASDPGGSTAAWLGGVTGSQRSAVTLPVCGSTCEEKPPWVWGDREVLDVKLKRAAAQPQLAGGEGLRR